MEASAPSLGLESHPAAPSDSTRSGYSLGRTRRRPRPEGIRITKVGFWWVLFTLFVGVAATNTGNNSLYLVLAVMLGTLVVSGVVSRQNVASLEFDLSGPDEAFARQPVVLDYSIRNRSRFFQRWFLLLTLGRSAPPRFVPFLPRRGIRQGKAELLFSERGLQRLEAVHVSSLFPFGFFRKGASYRLGAELLVYPELFPEASMPLDRPENDGEGGSRRPGRGHDLHGMRGFRVGDDPRGIHWKQTARTGSLVYMEREAERSQRLSILLDNATSEPPDEATAKRFERLVSEAATTAVDYLSRGFDIELVDRDGRLPFGGGQRQRVGVLERLALIKIRVDPEAGRTGALRSGDAQSPKMRLVLEGQRNAPRPNSDSTASPMPNGPGAPAAGGAR